MRRSRCVLALLVPWFLAVPALGQTLSPGPEIQIAPATFFGIHETVPALAVGADDGFLSAWREAGALNLRAFSPADAPAGPVMQLRPAAPSPSDPQLAALGAGRSVAVWSEGEIFAQILDATGSPVGSRLELAPSGYQPSVAASADGGFVVAWNQSGVIRVGRFDAQGQPAGPEIITTLGVTHAVAALPGGGFALAWTYPAQGSVGLAVAVRTFRADGTPLGEAVVASDPGNDLAHPSVRLSADAAGRFAVAWVELEASTFHSEVWARRFSPEGRPLSTGTRVAETSDTSRVLLLGDVASRPDGSFLVTWEEQDAAIDGPSATPVEHWPVKGDVLARALNGRGVPLGDAFLVHASAEGEQHSGEAEATADGWIVSWRLRLDPESGIYARRFALSCGTGGELCLANGLFRLSVTWRVPATGARGEGMPLQMAGDTGAFWFFDPTNAELVVKVLDGTQVNGNVWVFYGSLTDVEFDLTVTDALTGARRVYHNPAGTLASRGDTRAFPGAAPFGGLVPVGPPGGTSPLPCTGTSLCLQDGRFQIQVDWHVPATGARGRGNATPLAAQTGTFWFFHPGNVELIVKVLDGRGINGHFWVFYGSLTDVEFDLTVTDTATTEQRVYHNPAGTMASRADTEAF